MKSYTTACVLLLLVAPKVTNATSTVAPDATTAESSCVIALNEHNGESSVNPQMEKHEIALLMLLGFCGFSIFVAVGYKKLRKYVFHDAHNLDTVFDAGGRVSLSLTAVTVTSQLLWPSDFALVSSISSGSGIGGTLWLGVAVVLDIVLFPTLSLYLKTRAPGAKTFPQIAYARFGKATHIVFCILALATNLTVTTSIMLAGRSAITVLSKDTNNEFIFLLLAVLFGSYCLIGGLGTTFYMSYFNTALTFITISVYTLYTSFYPSEDIKKDSSLEELYKAVTCIEGPQGNSKNSLMTFRSESGLLFGVIVLFMATSINFCDQANWQSRIAAKPTQGVFGFFFAAYMWFVVPTSVSLTTTLSYFTMSFQNGTHLLSEGEISDGYIIPFVMNHLLGETGGYILLTMITMALMSTGSGEVMAISSIIVYDIYKTHINPFRENLRPIDCILCGRPKQIDDSVMKNVAYCACPSSIDCKACEVDLETRSTSGKKFAVHYMCDIHGAYRHYEDGLWRYKSWCMACVIVAIVPYGLLVSETGINVTWATVAVPVIGTPFLWSLFLTITWSKATSKGVLSGGIIGLVCSIAGMLIMGSTYEGGLNEFWANTAQDYSLLTGMVAGFVVSGILCIGVSLCTHNIKSESDSLREWAKTMNIDNPLSPYRLIYAEELEEVNAGPIITAETMDTIFRKAKRVAYIGAGFTFLLFLVVIPAIALSVDVLTLDQFTTWIRIFQYWLFCGTGLVVLVPPIEEAIQIWVKHRENVNKRRAKIA